MSAEPPIGPERPAGLPPSRIEALADGIFAVAMTILVLDLHVPELLRDAPDASIEANLAQLGPKALSYVSGFVILGTLWVGHHYLMHHLRRVDRSFLWINLLFLLAISFLPFVIALIGAFGPRKISCLLYGATLVVAGSCLLGQWRYAARSRRLVSEGLSAAEYSALHGRILYGVLGYGLGLALAPLWPVLSLCCYAAVPVVYLLPGRIDRHVAARAN